MVKFSYLLDMICIQILYKTSSRNHFFEYLANWNKTLTGHVSPSKEYCSVGVSHVEEK
jgi:hypothetical protein